jgi:trans-2-enoyl-CoA reductase
MRVYVEMTYRTKAGKQMQHSLELDATDLEAGHKQAVEKLKSDQRRKVDRVVYSRAVPMGDV